MMNSSIFANNVMSTYLAMRRSKSMQSLIAAVFSSMMNDDKIWFAHTKICRPDPIRFFPSSGNFLISFANAFACCLYTLFVLAYLLDEQEVMAIRIKK